MNGYFSKSNVVVVALAVAPVKGTIYYFIKKISLGVAKMFQQ